MKIQFQLVLFVGIIGLLVAIPAVSAYEDPQWKENALIVGEHLAGPVINNFKYVNGEDFTVVRSEILVQPGITKDLYYVFLVEDKEGQLYLGYAGCKDISFLKLYSGDGSRTLDETGANFITTEIVSGEESEDMISDIEGTINQLRAMSEDRDSKLFRQEYDGMNPKKDSYVVLHKLE